MPENTTAKERPILFSGEMVKALLEGRKTMTRRVLKVKNVLPVYAPGEFGRESEPLTQWHFPGLFERESCCPDHLTLDEVAQRTGLYCPYGKPGDQLWVKEKWATIADEDECSISEITAMNEMGPATLFYEAGPRGYPEGKWRQSRFMPRWASRITLEIVSVKVERLQDISEADAVAEGIKYPPLYADEPLPSPDYARKAFSYLWDSINAKKAPWESNPWVWGIEFKVIQKGDLK